MTATRAQVFLFPQKEKSIKRYHQWIFSGAIESIEGTAIEGDLVDVYSAEKEFLAIGHIQSGAIAVRILSFEPVEIDENFWFSRLNAAFDLRKNQLLSKQNQTNAYRLVHGEGDQLPGLIIDIYNKTAVFQAHSVGMYLARTQIAEALMKLAGLGIDSVYDKSSHALNLEEFDASDEFLIEGPRKEPKTVISEYGNTFVVNFAEGQKTGFFLDQRENRNLLGNYSKGKRVLNLFAYSGGFSVYALANGAEEVHSVDSSQSAIDLCNENIELNFGKGARHQGICEDGFQFLKNDLTEYDVVVLDPPAFAKHPKSVKNAHIGYKRLNQQAIKSMKSRSLLFTFSCSQAFSKEDFQRAIFSAARSAHREVRILHQLTQPLDHPINLFHPEGEYLKGFVLYII